MTTSFKNQDIYFMVLVAFLGLFISVMRFEYSQHEDMGIFLSEFSLIASGHIPYKEIFEIKDPLFLLSGGLFYKIFGIQGVYLLDVFLAIVSGALSYKVARQLNLNQTFALIASIIFLLTLFGGYYQTLRSTLFALVLILFALYSALGKRYILAGFTVALVGGFKMPYLFIAPSMLPLIIFSEESVTVGLKQLLKATIGFFLGSFIIFIILFLLADVQPYIAMVQENFSYAKNYPEIVGMKSGFSGHLKNIRAYHSNFYISLACLLGVSVLGIFNSSKLKIRDFLTLVLMSFLTLILCGFMVMWPHHLHVMVFYVWPLSLVVFMIFQKLTCNDSSSKHFMNALSIFFSAFFLCYAMAMSGTTLPIKSILKVSSILQPSWYIPPESSLLEDLYSKRKLTKSFARLGPNDDMGLGAFVGDSWRLSCSRYCQGGFESEASLEKTLACIDTKPNYVVISQGFFELRRPKGPFEDFRNKALTTIKEKFNCNTISPNSLNQVCVRKN